MNATTIGQSSVASGQNSIAMGQGAQATTNGAVAIGQAAQAVGTNSTAIGTGAVAIANGSVALGQGSASDRGNTVSIGNSATGTTRQITNVAAGVEANDAVNVAQFLTGLGTLDAILNKRIDQTGALTAAMSQIQLPRGAYNGLGVGLGSQGGESAIAFSLIGTISPNMLVKITAGNAGQINNVSGGITLGW